MSRSRFFAWMLVVAIFVWSCTGRAVSSRPLAAADGNTRDDDEPCAAGGAVAAAGTGTGGASRGQVREIWNKRRSLGDRSLRSPPAPLWNTPRTMPVPSPPRV